MQFFYHFQNILMNTSLSSDGHSVWGNPKCTYFSNFIRTFSNEWKCSYFLCNPTLSIYVQIRHVLTTTFTYFITFLWLKKYLRKLVEKLRIHTSVYISDFVVFKNGHWNVIKIQTLLANMMTHFFRNTNDDSRIGRLIQIFS